jgi:hypothetical protein
VDNLELDGDLDITDADIDAVGTTDVVIGAESNSKHADA